MALLLALDVPARLATLDSSGYPHITPIWFHWDGSVARMTSLLFKPHVGPLRRDGRACLLVDAEDAERSDGHRPNRQVRLIGDVVLYDDIGGEWTRVITDRYLSGRGAAKQADDPAAQPRIVMELRPTDVVAVASV